MTKGADLLDAKSSDSFYLGLQTDVNGFRSLKVYIALMYGALYKYQLFKLSGLQRERTAKGPAGEVEE